MAPLSKSFTDPSTHLVFKDTFQKMTWLTYGNQLSTYLGSDIPKEYGGSGVSLKDKSLTPRYDDTSKATNGEASKDVKPQASEAANEESVKGDKEEGEAKDQTPAAAST